MNYAEEYIELIHNGDITACKEITAYYELLHEQLNDPDFPYYFSENAGNHAIEFIETFCRHYQGSKAGSVVKLELFQKAFVQTLFGWLDKTTKRRRYHEYFFEVARKHGKSFLSGCIACYMLVADGEQGAEIYSAANKLDQAKVIYNVTKAIVEQSPELAALVKSTREGLSFKATRSVMRPLPNESKSSDGLNIHFAALDEIHEQRDRNMYDVLRQATKARQNPIVGCITTAGFYRDGLYDDLHDYAVKVATGEIEDNTFLPLIYKLDDENEWKDPEMWMKANPGLGTIKSREQLAHDVERAKEDKAYLPTLLTKDFDIKQTQSHNWLTMSQVVNETIFDPETLRGCYGIGGCDLSSVYDLTCATIIVKRPDDENIYVLQHYWLPRKRIEMLEDTKSKEAPYELWESKGWLTINDGSQVDYHLVTEWFYEVYQTMGITPVWIFYDRALSGYWSQEMVEYGFDMVKLPQGPITWTYPMKLLKSELDAHHIIYNNNPVLRWCLSNTGVKTANPDGIESIQPIKLAQNRRIDGLVSLLNAYTGMIKRGDEYMNYVNYSKS